VVGDAGLTANALLELVATKSDRDHLEDAVGRYASGREDQRQLADPAYDGTGFAVAKLSEELESHRG
jgi:hypothetical protein